MAGIAAATHRYRGREITAADILYIEELIGAHPGASRRTLSKKLCEAWEWRQPNGALRDMVCRGMLLMLDRAGQIALPPVSYLRHNPLAKRARPSAPPTHGRQGRNLGEGHKAPVDCGGDGQPQGQAGGGNE